MPRTRFQIAKATRIDANVTNENNNSTAKVKGNENENIQNTMVQSSTDENSAANANLTSQQSQPPITPAAVKRVAFGRPSSAALLVFDSASPVSATKNSGNGNSKEDEDSLAIGSPLSKFKKNIDGSTEEGAPNSEQQESGNTPSKKKKRNSNRKRMSTLEDVDEYWQKHAGDWAKPLIAASKEKERESQEKEKEKEKEEKGSELPANHFKYRESEFISQEEEQELLAKKEEKEMPNFVIDGSYYTTSEEEGSSDMTAMMDVDQHWGQEENIMADESKETKKTDSSVIIRRERKSLANQPPPQRLSTAGITLPNLPVKMAIATTEISQDDEKRNNEMAEMEIDQQQFDEESFSGGEDNSENEMIQEEGITEGQEGQEDQEKEKKKGRKPSSKKLKQDSQKMDVSLDSSRPERKKIRPLQYWRNEKIIYGRRQSGFCPVPIIKDIVTLSPEEQSVSLSNSSRRTGSADLSEYKQKIEARLTVNDFERPGKSSKKLVAVSADAVKVKPVEGTDFKMATVFHEGDFFSSGIIAFPPHSHKPNRNSSNHVLSFFVISGAVSVNLNASSFIASKGAQFIIPRGNQYEIQNVGKREAKLYFCYCRDTSDFSASHSSSASSSSSTGSDERD